MEHYKEDSTWIKHSLSVWGEQAPELVTSATYTAPPYLAWLPINDITESDLKAEEVSVSCSKPIKNACKFIENKKHSLLW